MKIQRGVKTVSSFLIQLAAALLKTALTSVILGTIVMTAMHYMGVPVPSAADMLRGVSRLANVLS